MNNYFQIIPVSVRGYQLYHSCCLASLHANISSGSTSHMIRVSSTDLAWLAGKFCIKSNILKTIGYSTPVPHSQAANAQIINHTVDNVAGTKLKLAASWHQKHADNLKLFVSGRTIANKANLHILHLIYIILFYSNVDYCGLMRIIVDCHGFSMFQNP